MYGHFEYITMQLDWQTPRQPFNEQWNWLCLGYSGISVLSYCDNIIIFSKTLKEHVDRMKQVLREIHEASLWYEARKM